MVYLRGKRKFEKIRKGVEDSEYMRLRKLGYSPSEALKTARQISYATATARGFYRTEKRRR